MKKLVKDDQATSLRELVEHVQLNSEDSVLSNKVFQLISEVRKEIAKKYSISTPIAEMHWDEKIDKLPSEAWMMEQVMCMLERFVERQTGRFAREGRKTAKVPGRHGKEPRGIKD